MPTGLTAKIYDGDAVELPDIIWNLMQGFLFDFRDNNKLKTIAQLAASFDKDIKKAEEDLDKALNGLIDLAKTSDDQLLAGEEAARARNIQFNDECRTAGEAVIARYRAAEQKLIDWTPPESVLDLKNGMLRHLREQIEYETRHLISERDNKPLVASEVRAIRQRYLEQSRDRALAEIETQKANKERVLKFRTELYAELNRIGLKV